MYAVRLASDELYKAVVYDESKAEEVYKKAKIKAVNIDYENGYVYCLYLRPKQRNQAYLALRKIFKSACVIANPAYVPVDQIAKYDG